MLINKWLLTDDIATHAHTNAQTGICMVLKNTINNRKFFFEYVQQQLTLVPFSILLDGKGTGNAEEDAIFIEDVISLFFQPSYYTENNAPVVFVNSVGSGIEVLKKTLEEKSVLQGFKPVLFKEISFAELGAENKKSFNFLLHNSAFAYDLVLKKWIDECITKKNAPEIHLLIQAANVDSGKIVTGLNEQEASIKNTEVYKLALFLYGQLQLIRDYQHQLEIKTAEAKNARLYLSIQKEERANALKWYDKEYEVLPLWYKQFGHIIKVLTGKRTFRSLFKDDVKKLKV